ncbi:Oxygen oxidoreductase covalent FAD-binding site [Macrophomina phaseolina MS6]|uniref:Oxygen oxidoreductase covalent FAD-binding site n=1 Tax=Macrophomina phaseolina (strain MS6) TaxID=1126212 RepID=K2QZ85_MACPH|nr:Oxygen oxidoreductase covalent FAD-binding site [Macrophomina phaseolina MS6]
MDSRCELLKELRSQAPNLSVHDRTSSFFAELQLYYNRGLAQEPLAIVRPTTEEEVSEVIGFCSAKGIPLTVRSGGHDFFGRSQAGNGIVLDMRLIDHITIAPDKTTATVGGGVLAGALQQELNAHDLFTPTGHSSSVGYASWACGGGYGFYVGTYGFGVDQIVQARVVVASGRVVDTDQDSELLWGLRGAGAGTFGVVTQLCVRIYPMPRLYAGLLAFPLSEASVLLEQFERHVSEDGIPDEFSGDAFVARPEMLQLASSVSCFVFLWCWTSVGGNVTRAKVYLDKIKSLGTVVVNTVEESKSSVGPSIISRTLS